MEMEDEKKAVRLCARGQKMTGWIIVSNREARGW
jgi:hypothetical protein